MAGIAGAIGRIDDRVRDAVRHMDTHLSRGGRDHGGVHEAGGDGTTLVVAWRFGSADRQRDAEPAIHARSGVTAVRYGRLFGDDAGGSPASTAALLDSYTAHGPEAITRLQGVYAMVIHDPAGNRTVLARDRVGVKSLYVQRIDGALLFATEIAALLAGGLTPRRLEPAALATYVWNGFVTGPVTMVRDVTAVPPGCCLTFDHANAATRLERHWRVPANTPRPDGEEALGAALRSSVRRRLDAAGDVGLFLSGGVDSSAIVALACEVGERPLRTFNVSFDEVEFDESAYARDVARRLGTRHEEIRVSEACFREQVETALASLDQPSFDALNSFLVSRAVREHGVTAALGGTGGDDLFGGNATFVDIPRAMRWSRRSAPIPATLIRAAAPLMVRAMVGRSGAIPPQTRWGKLADVLLTRGRLAELYQLSYALFTPDFGRSLLVDGHDGVSFGVTSPRFDELVELVADRETMYGIATLELEIFVADRLLRDIESVGNAVGLDVCSPLLDDAVLDCWSNVEQSRLFRPIGRKQLLRDLALQSLDPTLFDRPKRGFVLPLERWCVQGLKDRLDEVLLDRQLCDRVGLAPDRVEAVWQAFQHGAPGMYWSRIWALFVLLWWCRKHEMRR